MSKSDSVSARRTEPLDPVLVKSVRCAVDRLGVVETARRLGVGREAVLRVLAGVGLQLSTRTAVSLAAARLVAPAQIQRPSAA